MNFFVRFVGFLIGIRAADRDRTAGHRTRPQRSHGSIRIACGKSVAAVSNDAAQTVIHKGLRVGIGENYINAFVNKDSEIYGSPVSV